MMFSEAAVWTAQTDEGTLALLCELAGTSELIPINIWACFAALSEKDPTGKCKSLLKGTVPLNLSIRGHGFTGLALFKDDWGAELKETTLLSIKEETTGNNLAAVVV